MINRIFDGTDVASDETYSSRDVTFGDDVCVVTLDRPFDIDGEHVDTIDINEDKSQPEVGATCQVVVWGSAQKYNVRVSETQT